MAQVQVITGAERRRRWSEEQKRALVAEAFAPGAVVMDVARRADVSATVLYRWRRQFTPGAAFAQMMLAAPETSAGVPPACAIEIDFGNGSRVRIPASIRPELAAAIVKALARSS